MNIKEINQEFITLFNATINGCGTPVNVIDINQKAMKLGYIVTREACTSEVNRWLDNQNVDYNSTFYKEWTDITSKTRFELFIDQVLHYMTTYGTDFCLGNGYVPNDQEGRPEFEFSKYKVITAVSEKEMFLRVMNLMTSGIAIRSSLVATICDYIYTYATINSVEVDIDQISNREARIILYDKFNKAPKDAFELIKYMYYKATGSPMIVKNKVNLANVRYNSSKFDFRILNEAQLAGLASIFYRYKDIILMFKSYAPNRPIINRIRRMAVKCHQPMKPGYWENILTICPTENEIYQKSAELTNYKIVTLMNMLYEHMNMTSGDNVMYIIRNGKVYFDKSYNVQPMDVLMRMYNGLYKRLVENMAEKSNVIEKITKTNPLDGKTVEIVNKRKAVVKIDKNLRLAVPTSEKNFIGNIPFGSYAEMSKNNIIGCYWRNEWGTHDFDLSMNDVNGNRIGWNSSYRTNDNSVIYSGDMTNAQPEATELLFCKNTMPNGTVYVNRYNGNEGSSFKIFYATENIPDYNHMHNYMVDPSNIKASSMCQSVNREKMCAVVNDGRMVFADFSTGNSQVARASGVSQSDIYKIIARKLSSMVFVDDILKAAGFTVVYDGDCDINLIDLNKDSLISLFNKE